jgi:hypothetical protein
MLARECPRPSIDRPLAGSKLFHCSRRLRFTLILKFKNLPRSLLSLLPVRFVFVFATLLVASDVLANQRAPITCCSPRGAETNRRRSLCEFVLLFFSIQKVMVRYW